MAESKNSEPTAADAFLLKDAQFLLHALENGLPSGETPDTVAEILELRIRQLEEMTPQKGRGALIMDLRNHLDKYRDQSETTKKPTAMPAQENTDGIQSSLI